MAGKRAVHFFSVRSQDASRWATLKLLGDAFNEHDQPVLVQGSSLEGVLMRNLNENATVLGRHKNNIDRVDVLVIGMFCQFERDEDDNLENICSEFLRLQHTIWTASDDGADLSDEPLDIPFEVELPETVELPSGDGLKTCSLPQSFSNIDVGTSVSYRLAVHFYVGSLRAEEEILAPFQYIPRIESPPPSPARLKAYKEKLPLCGPREDPDGWQVCGTVKTEAGDVAVALAKPLVYTRGTPIPIFLSSPAEDCYIAPLSAVLCSHHKMHSCKTKRRIPPAEQTHDVHQALFWQSGCDGWDWEGEVVVPEDARVGCDMPGRYEMKYTVTFYRTPSSCTSPCCKALRRPALEVPIEIAPFSTVDAPLKGENTST